MFTHSDRGPSGAALSDSMRAGLSLGLTLHHDPLLDPEVAYRREQLLRAARRGGGRDRSETGQRASGDRGESVSRWTAWRHSVRWQRSSAARTSSVACGH